MTATQAQIDALEKAINTGARSISYDGKQTTFRSLAEMQSLLAQLQHEFAGTVSMGVNLATFSKGTA